MPETTIHGELTAEESYQLRDPIEGGRIELIEGHVVANPPGGGRRGATIGRLGSRLGLLDRNDSVLATLGSGYLIGSDPDTVLCPSIALVRPERLPGGELSESFVPVAPDLAVEVVPGPSGAEAEDDRLRRYLNAGVRVWVVDLPTRSVAVYSPGRTQRVLAEGDSLGPDELGVEGADFSLPVADIFR